MKILVGLGNPGKEYEKTRHNVGSMIIDEIIDNYHLYSGKKKFHAIINEGTINGKKVVLAKPQTFMNKSGLSVQEILHFYKITPQDIIVFHDELDIQTGKLRVKIGGGNGGHNGLKDIDAKIGKEYKRVRFGIDHPGDKNKVSSYVLNNFKKDEIDIVNSKIYAISSNIPSLLENKDDLFMTRVSES